MSATRTVTFFVGQAVPWPPAPSRFAQIVELRRKKVRLFYRTKNGKPRFALAKVEKLCVEQMMFEMDNPYGRGRIRKSKTFRI